MDIAQILNRLTCFAQGHQYVILAYLGKGARKVGCECCNSVWFLQWGDDRGLRRWKSERPEKHYNP